MGLDVVGRGWFVFSFVFVFVDDFVYYYLCYLLIFLSSLSLSLILLLWTLLFFSPTNFLPNQMFLVLVYSCWSC